MRDAREHLDTELASLADAVASGEHMLACRQLADFAIKLDHYIVREERVLSEACRSAGVLRMRARAIAEREHTSLRQLVESIATALEQSDARRGADVIGTLRSVLLLHLTKEELLRA